MKIVYRGKIRLGVEWDDVVYLGDDGESLGERVSADREKHGEYASVKYFICAQDVPEDKITEAYLQHLLIEEIRSHNGFYLHLEIEYFTEPKPKM